MAYMRMPMPRNSMPMAAVQLQYGKSTAGGMFTVLKVREQLAGYEDPGWYRHPEGTVAAQAAPEELQRDGIAVAGQEQAAPADPHQHHQHHSG
jgi:hypothetical protein